MAAADQALLDKIQKLSGALRRAQDTPATGKPPYNSHNHSHGYQGYSRGRGRFQYPRYMSARDPPPATKSVEIGGELFNASRNKLTRKDPSDPSGSTVPEPKPFNSYSRGRSRPRGRFGMQQSGVHVYKPKIPGRRHHPNMSLVLNKVNRKKAKLEKQCPYFSRTGMCNRGKSCRYQHDPEKVAICPRYLAGDCPSTAETCLLSHSSTLNRVPPCVHFQNNGKCKNGDQCLYPHVRLGAKSSVCRDFAVLGYCEKGIDCDAAHIRECPDFAESGVCKNPKCKLPHVIRSTRKAFSVAGKQVVGSAKAPDSRADKATDLSDKEEKSTLVVSSKNADPPNPPTSGTEFTFEGGDEYIPLTFVESDEDDGEGDPDSDDKSEDDEIDDAERQEEEAEQEEVEFTVFA